MEHDARYSSDHSPPPTTHFSGSYVDSHKAPGKGVEYDAYYSSDHEAQYLWQQERRVLVRLLHEFFDGRSAHLLDFACGTGRITSFLETRVESSCAVDVSDSMLEVARQKLVRTRLLKVNLLEENPFPNNHFNLITAFRFFLNAELELRAAAWRALTPLLADDGCLVFNIHQNRHSLYYWPKRLYCRARHREPVTTLAIGECAHALKQVGLKIIRIYPVGFLRIPKLHFPDRIREVIDGAAMRSDLLSRFSDSPIIVARRSAS
jgi:SAM-dependent methyltransferase